MAKSSNNTAMFMIGAFVLALLLVVDVSEGRATISASKEADPKLSVTCNSFVGVKENETCASIVATNNLSTTTFLAKNPNINCQTIYVGQWVCVDGN